MAYFPPPADNAALTLRAGYTPPPGNVASLNLGHRLYEIDQAVEIPVTMTVALDQAVEIALPMTTGWETAATEIDLAITSFWQDQAVEFDINFYLEQFVIINLPVTTPLDQACVIMLDVATELDQAVEIDLSARTPLDQAVEINLPIATAELDQAVEIDLDASDRTPLDQAVEVIRSAYPQAAVDGLVFTITAGGQPLESVTNIRLRRDRSLYYNSGSVVLADRAEFLACPDGTPVVISINGENVVLRVVDRKRSRTETTRGYTVDLASPAVILGEPYAARIDGQYVGMASQISAGLAGDIPLSWVTVDSYIPADVHTVTNSLPIDTIRPLVEAPGAILVSELDGSLTVEPQYPLPVPAWSTAAPDYTIIDNIDILDDSEDEEYRQIFNKYLVGNNPDSATSSGGLRIETVAEDDGSWLVRLYTTPWDNSVALSHRGGYWVQMEYLGDEIRTVPDETVVVVGGTGSCAYPVEQVLSSVWREADLGAVTAEQDGELTAATPGDSLLAITYQTRSRNFRFRNTREEKVLIVAFTLDSATAAGASVWVQRAPADSIGPQVQDQLAVSNAVKRERGRNLIDGSCSPRKLVQMTCPFTGFRRPGKLVEVFDAENPRWRGMLLIQEDTFDLPTDAGDELTAISALTIEREVEA